MANSTLSLITSLAFIVLFSLAIISFSIDFANDNSADVRIDQDDNMSSLDIITQSGLGTLKSDTEDTYSSIVNTTIESGSDVIKSPGVFTITWKNMFVTFGNILKVIDSKIFGGNPTFRIFITAFLTILGIMFTLYIIKAWRGNP